MLRAVDASAEPTPPVHRHRNDYIWLELPQTLLVLPEQQPAQRPGQQFPLWLFHLDNELLQLRMIFTQGRHRIEMKSVRSAQGTSARGLRRKRNKTAAFRTRVLFLRHDLRNARLAQKNAVISRPVVRSHPRPAPRAMRREKQIPAGAGPTDKATEGNGMCHGQFIKENPSCVTCRFFLCFRHR
jgi:hypothetical protein